MSITLRWLIVVAVVGLSTVFGCSDDTATSPGNADDDPVDVITIKSVTPDSGLPPGVATDFVVTVEYELISADSGEVMIGFNTDEADRFAMISAASALVIKGPGEHEFNVNAVTRDWGIAGDFKLYVNLSEHPHGPSWTPLATDVRMLPVN